MLVLSSPFGKYRVWIFKKISLKKIASAYRFDLTHHLRRTKKNMVFTGDLLLEKIGESRRKVEKVGESWRKSENVGESWRKS